MPRTLSKSAEQQIIDGLKVAVDLVEQGQTPDQALEQQARERQWGPDMIRFASHAYNTGQQTAQRESGQNTRDKLAEFQLADPDRVIRAVWPEHVKSSADLQLEAVSPEYTRPPAWVEPRDREARRAKLAAAPLRLTEESPAPYTPDPKQAAARAYHGYARLKRAAEESRRRESAAHDRLWASLGELGQYFKQAASDRLPMANVEKSASVYHGPAVSRLFDYVQTRNRTKEARADDRTPLVKATGRPFDLVSACMDAGRELGAAKAASVDARRQIAEYEQRSMRPHVPRTSTEPAPATRILPEPVTTKAAGLFSGAVGGTFAGGAKQLIERALGSTDPENQIRKQWEKIEDPEHDTAIRQIQAQSTVAELMDDPVIGGHDQDRVLQAYNEVASMAPRIATQPLAMRSLLRRHLEGNIEPFEAGQVTDLEKGLREAHKPEQGLLPESGANLMKGQ